MFCLDKNVIAEKPVTIGFSPDAFTRLIPRAIAAVNKTRTNGLRPVLGDVDKYAQRQRHKRIGVKKKSMRLILLLLLVLLLIGALPAWPYSTDWGYYPSGGLGLVLLIVLLVVFLR